MLCDSKLQYQEWLKPIRKIFKFLYGIVVWNLFKFIVKNLKIVFKAEQGNMEEALKRLEMPEVMTKRKPIEFVHSEDSLLKDHDEDGADYVFTDISTSKNMRVSNK